MIGIGTGFGPAQFIAAQTALPLPNATYSGAMVEEEDDQFIYCVLTGSGTLSFDADVSAMVEIIGGGGGGGCRRGNHPGGGGGAGGYQRQQVDLMAGTDYTITIGAGGAGESAQGSSFDAQIGGDTVAFGFTSPGGGAGNGEGSGSAGACGGGNGYRWHNGPGQGNFAAGPYTGGAGAPASGNGATDEPGAGGGMGGDATASTGQGVLSVPGPGVSDLRGGTVCAGGAARLRGVYGSGAAPSNPGDGGHAGNDPDYGAPYETGGTGGAGQVVIRLRKDGGTSVSLTVAEPAFRDFGYALNSAMTSAVVPFSGTDNSGLPGNIDVRVVTETGTEVLGWQSAVTTSDGTAFSGTITVPQRSERLLLNLRKDGGDVFPQTIGWRTAAVVVGYGQSNSVNRLMQAGGKPELVDGASVLAATETAIEGFPSLNGASMAPGTGAGVCVNTLRGLLNVPVMLIIGGQGGTPIANLGSGSNPMTELLNGVGLVSHVHGILWNQGEADVVRLGNGSTTEAGYAAALDAIRSTIARPGQTASDIPIIVSPLATIYEVSPSGNYAAADWQAFKDFQNGPLVPAVAGLHIAAPADDMVRADGIHGFGESYGRVTAREARKLAGILSGSVPAMDLFRVGSVTAQSGTVTRVSLTHALGSDWEIVTLTHDEEGGTDGQVDAALGTVTSLEVSEDGSTWTPATLTRVDASTFDLTHADIGTAGTRALRYFHGLNPDGVIRDTSSYAVPLSPVMP